MRVYIQVTNSESRAKMDDPIHAKKNNMTTKIDLKTLYALWDDFSAISVRTNGVIDSPFQHFPAGAPVEEIWNWFEAQNSRFCLDDIVNDLRLEPLTLNRRLFKWRQSVDSFCDGLAGNDQICDDAVVDIQVSLVLSQVPYAVTLIEHTPNSRAKVKCLWQQLKYDISVTGAIAVPT